MLRKTSTRKVSDLTEFDRSSVGNGEIGQSCRRVRSLGISDNTASQKRIKKSINENPKSIRVSDVYKDSVIAFSNNNNKYSEYFTSNTEHRERSELHFPSASGTCKQSSGTSEGNHYEENGVVHSTFKNDEDSSDKALSIPSSNHKIEFCLALYCLFSLIYLNILVSLEKKHLYFSSIQEALLYKIVWCLGFGAIVDLFLLKLAIQIQSLFWISLFISKFLKNPLCSNAFAKICLSSSSSLVAEIMIIKLYKREKCWLPICRFNIISSLCLFCGQFFIHNTFTSSREALWNLIKERLFNAQSFDCFNYFTEYMDVDLSSVMSIGCALCLLTVAYLYSEEIERSEYRTSLDSDYSALSRKFLSCVRVLLLKVIIFLPAFCFATIFNSYIDKWILVLMPLQFIALCCLLVIGHYLSASWILSDLSLLMCFCSFIIIYLHRFLHSWVSIPAVMFSVVMVMIKPSFHYYARQQLSESFLGLTFSTLISMHFIMKYFSPLIIDAIKSSDILESFKLF